MDILGIDSLFAELTVGIGLAMIGGNGWAMIQNVRGRRPEGAEGRYRPGRAWFFIVIGVVMVAWGALTLTQS